MGNKLTQTGIPEPNIQQLLRRLPKIDDCLAALTAKPSLHSIPHACIKSSVRDFIDLQRQRIFKHELVDEKVLNLSQMLPAMIDHILKKDQVQFRRVINATGVIVHTNLGRSLLPAETMDAIHEAGAHYSNLEFDLETGSRGSRYSLVEDLLCELTGAEAGLVVNNNAAAVLIVLETLAKGSEVIVSRGQLVEIGGSFRIPDVMRRSGATLVEVGATNRTHLHDYRTAISDETGLLLKVHCSNYRIIGFTKEVENKELVALGREQGIPVAEDLGSGCLVDLSCYGLMKEPTVQEVIASGVDVVTFSGDKLLGGPQAGIIVGKKTIIEKIKRNPLNRALRIDKFTLSGLESILRLYRDEQTALATIPTLAMISASIEVVDKRARRLLRLLRKDLKSHCTFSVIDAASRVGGGAMPEQNLPSRAVTVEPQHLAVNRLECALRSRDIPVIGRIEADRLLLDMRTVGDDEVPLLHKALRGIFY